MEFIRFENFLRKQNFSFKGVDNRYERRQRELFGSRGMLKDKVSVDDFEELCNVFNQVFSVLGNVFREELVNKLPNIIVRFRPLIDGTPKKKEDIVFIDEECVVHVMDNVTVFI